MVFEAIKVLDTHVVFSKIKSDTNTAPCREIRDRHDYVHKRSWDDTVLCFVAVRHVVTYSSGHCSEFGVYRYIEGFLSLVSGRTVKLGDTLTNNRDQRPARCMLLGEPACSSDV
jgi:hypothetical protein